MRGFNVGFFFYQAFIECSMIFFMVVWFGNVTILNRNQQVSLVFPIDMGASEFVLDGKWW